MNIKFGCEFEFSTDIEIVANIVKEVLGNELTHRNEYFKSKNNRKWHLKTDSSTCCELCTPVSSYDDMEYICSVIQHISRSKIKTTKNDSMHVHVRTNKVSKENLITAWIMIEKTLIKCFPKHRRQKYGYYSKNNYCGMLINHTAKKNIASLLNSAMKISDDHHSVFSSKYYESRGTVEFRISEGTTKIKHVKNWVKFCLQFINFAKDINPYESLTSIPYKMNIEELISVMNIRDYNLGQWLKERYNLYEI